MNRLKSRRVPRGLMRFAGVLLAGLLLTSCAVLVGYYFAKEPPEATVTAAAKSPEPALKSLAPPVNPRTPLPLTTATPHPFLSTPPASLTPTTPIASTSRSSATTLTAPSTPTASSTAMAPSTSKSLAPSIQSLPAARSSNPVDFVLQVGAMREEENARNLSNTLRQMNFPVFVSRHDDGLLHVAVGPYLDANSALAVKNELEKRGFQTILRHRLAK